MLQRTLALMIFTLLAGCGQAEPQKAEPEANNAPQYSEAELQEYANLCRNGKSTSPIESVRACIAINKATKSYWLNLEQRDLQELPDDIFSGLDHVTILSLNENKLSSLPSSISELKNLRVIYLDVNNFKSIPNELFSLSNVKDIFMSRNMIESVDEGIVKMTSLRRVVLSMNKLGEFPSPFLELSNLKIIDLSLNSISHVPKDINKMKGLIGISLADNSVESLPKELGEIRGLTMLDFSSNKLKSIPVEISALPNLVVKVEGHRDSVKHFATMDFEEDGKEIHGVGLLSGEKTVIPLIQYSGLNILFNDIDRLDSSFCKVFFLKKDADVSLECN